MNPIPDSTGVYLLYDKNKKVIYVGKATSLRNRLAAYFSKGKNTDWKIANLKEEINSFDYIITKDEIDSLILEANLIKKYKPKYNIRLKDDKSYPYLKITLAEEFPRLLITRKFEEDGSKYFGPYSGTKSLKWAIRLLKQFFPISSCKKKKITDKPCLNYHLGKCAAPCAGKIEKENYRKIIHSAISLLEGNIESVTSQLETEMQTASSNLEFEKAALIRDKINALQEISKKQTVLFTDNRNSDVIGSVGKENLYSVSVLHIRNGKLWEKDNFLLNSPFQTNKEEILLNFIKQYYNKNKFIPDEIILEAKVGKEIKIFLEKLANKKIKITLPSNKDEEGIMEIALKNALQKLSLTSEKEKEEFSKTKEDLKILVDKYPSLIAAIDASNIFGKCSVAGIVVFKEGLPEKNLYRKFKVKLENSLETKSKIFSKNKFLKSDKKFIHDDTSRIYEVSKRYFKKIKEKKEPQVDLIIIDGGKGQLSAAIKSAIETELEIPIISFAKGNKIIYTTKANCKMQRTEGKTTRKTHQEIIEFIPKNFQTINFIELIISEAHRFAITYHRKKRNDWLKEENQ